ncbi:zinc finger protein 318 isoform X2 [Cyprinodon tularosa]|uniref:zinc finger protein 318 isoform X2 n=1 Tax=Cyprinodon tularosa TaxID=77115 RepID=UPI0018E25036|nr:zinc finger protein 318 isoform X2 [Cyprinodon tularosa]
MYRGRPEFRDYPPPHRPHPSAGYRDERPRPRPPYHQDYPDYRDHAAQDPYRRRYSSPGSGGHRGGDFWSGASPLERSPSHRRPTHMDHNELVHHGSVPAPLHHERDYSPRLEYKRSSSRGRSPGRSKSRHRGQSRSPDQRRGRSKSRTRGKSRSPDRSRAKSRGRSKSRTRGKSRSPDRSRAKSRGRSKSRTRGKSRSPDRSRAKSRGRSKSRPRSKSRSRSRSKSRKSRGRSRSRQYRSSSSSSSSSIEKTDGKGDGFFKELEMARRKREVEELLGQPTKSILKKHNSYEASPSVRSTDSPGDLDRTMSHVADQLLQAVKMNDPLAVAAVLSELRSDPEMSQRANLNNEIKEILNLLGVAEPLGDVSEKALDDIDDEEKFLYGELEEPKILEAPEPARHSSLDLYGDVTEDSLYSDPPSQSAVSQVHSCPPSISPHPQATPTASEINRYVNQPSISADQNVTVQVSNPSYPPGMEPLDESERQALEEYEKIQDLLKTIGLDLGVNEITKMAARTKERLHGKKQPLKTPTRRRRHSSSSSNRSGRSRSRRHSQSESSSSSSRSRSRGRGTKRGASWSSEDHEPKKSMAPKTANDWEVKEAKSEWSTPMIPPTSDPAPIPTHTGMPIPTYPPPPLSGMMPPNFPPPGYSQYGNYLPYMHQQWPPMYPPPNMAQPPQTTTDEHPPPLTYNSKPSPAVESKGAVRAACQEEQQLQRGQDQNISDEQNKETEKLKVLEEREKLREEREVRMTKKEYLIKELERLRKQQGELLRKKRREKDGHKDPLLQEITRLQEEVMAKISNLRKEHEAAERKRSEIEKIALILGLSPSDRPIRTNKQPRNQRQEAVPPQMERLERERSREEQPAASSSVPIPVVSPKAFQEKLPSSAATPAPPPDPFEYYDAGNHWCKSCNITSGSMFDFFTHLHGKGHRKTLNPYDRPWASSNTNTSKSSTGEVKQTKPAKGSEFLVPVRGFFCMLCKEFCGDAICAEQHVITYSHNEKYKEQMMENPLYEQRRNLDRQAGLGLEAAGKKRKHDVDDRGSKDGEENTKTKKDKKDKKNEGEAAEKCDVKIKVKKEEGEHSEKPSKKSLEEDKPFSSKKDENESYKYSKKDEKYRHSREVEDRNSRYRSGGRDEEYRYHYCREDEKRYDDRTNSGTKDVGDKFKHDKFSDTRSKYDRERDEGKSKAERESAKSLGKPNVRKSEPQSKPHELPKIFCGPSPAMRAKLRKQALEAGKVQPATGPSIGKFTWTKKESQLAKEARQVAAEFIKDEEMAAKEQQGEDEDSLSKSIAIAKEIAEKLAGEPLKHPPFYQPGQGQIRPNLRAPVAQQRKAALAGKPASLNTFLNMRPQGSDGSSPGSIPRAPLGPPNTQMVQSIPGPPVNISGPCDPIPTPVVTKPEPFGPKLPPSVSKPEPCQDTSAGSKSDLADPRPAPSKAKQVFLKPSPLQSPPTPVPSKPSTIFPFPLRKESSETKALPSEVKASVSQAPKLPLTSPKAAPSQPPMMIVSDVAAPGVPESEQTCNVFVKPPPFKKLPEVSRKSEKFKNNLAAARAEDLIDMFYRSIGEPGPSSFSKSETDIKAGRSSSSAPQNKNQQQPQDKPPPQIESPNKAQTQSQNQPQLQGQLGSKIQTEQIPCDKTEAQSQTQLQSQGKTQPLTPLQPKIQPQTHSLPQDTPESQPTKQQLQTDNKPQIQLQAQDKSELKPQDKTQSQTQLQIQGTELQPQDKPEFQTQGQLQKLNKPDSHIPTQLQPQDKPDSQSQKQQQTPEKPDSDIPTQLQPQDKPDSQSQKQQQTPEKPDSDIPTQLQPQVKPDSQSQKQQQTPEKPASDIPTQLQPQDKPDSQSQKQQQTPEKPDSDIPTQLQPQNKPDSQSQKETQTLDKPDSQSQKRQQTLEKPDSDIPTQLQPQDKPDSQSQKEQQTPGKPDSDIPTQLKPQNKPDSQSQKKIQTLDKPDSQSQKRQQTLEKPDSDIPTQLQPQDKPDSQTQKKTQTLDKPESDIPTELQHQDKPDSQSQKQQQTLEKPDSHIPTQLQPQDKPNSQPLKLLQAKDKTKVQQQPHQENPQIANEPSDKHLDQSTHQTELQQQSRSVPDAQPIFTIPPQTESHQSLQSPPNQTDADIQITSVWSLQSPSVLSPKADCPDASFPMFQFEQTTEVLSQRESTDSGPESLIPPQTSPSTMEPIVQALSKPTPHINEAPQSESHADLDGNSHQEKTPQPQPKPKPGPRTRGKGAQMKKTPPANAPVRQTRSQTRYQTRQQQQQSDSEPKQEPAAVDQGMLDLDAEGLACFDPQQEADTVKETDPTETRVTPESLGLPSDMTSLDFDYTFNFE